MRTQGLRLREVHEVTSAQVGRVQERNHVVVVVARHVVLNNLFFVYCRIIHASEMSEVKEYYVRTCSIAYRKLDVPPTYP